MNRPRPITVRKVESHAAAPWFYLVNSAGATVAFGARRTQPEALTAAEDDLWMARVVHLATFGMAEVV